MKTTVFVGIGAVLILLGGTWTLQGLGFVKGSVMSGVTLWAIIGPIVAIIGLVIAVFGLRRRSSAP
jgi:hypothetical protein